MIGSTGRWRSWRWPETAGEEPVGTGLGYPGANQCQPQPTAWEVQGEHALPRRALQPRDQPQREGGPHPWDQPGRATAGLVQDWGYCCPKGRLDGSSLSFQWCWDGPEGLVLELYDWQPWAWAYFCLVWGQGLGCRSCSWRAGTAPFTRTTCWRHHWRYGRCGTACPSLLSLCHPTFPGPQFTPWCQVGAAAAHQRLLFVLLLLSGEGHRDVWGCSGAGFFDQSLGKWQ